MNEACAEPELEERCSWREMETMSEVGTCRE